MMCYPCFVLSQPHTHSILLITKWHYTKKPKGTVTVLKRREKSQRLRWESEMRGACLLEESLGWKNIINNLWNKGDIVREDGQYQAQEAVEVLAMNSRGSEPRKFKQKQLNELAIFIAWIIFKEHLDPELQLRWVDSGVHEGLLVNHCVEVLRVTLYRVNCLEDGWCPYLSFGFKCLE